MTSNPVSQTNLKTKTRIKWPYNPHEVSYLKWHISGCLRILSDTGKTVNYEEVFIAIGKLPEDIYAPEWQEYWLSKTKIMSSIKAKTKRHTFFKESITDAIVKWIFPTDSSSISWLTGNFSQTILSIIKNPTL
jgi:hypothetical protein